MAELTITQACIGCGACVALCPQVFMMNKQRTRALVKAPTLRCEGVDEAMEICPVACITRGVKDPSLPKRRSPSARGKRQTPTHTGLPRKRRMR